MDQIVRTVQAKFQASLGAGTGGSKYFASTRRGEAAELRADLSSSSLPRQKAAVKRVIANMTLGKDVRALFVHIVKLGHTTNLELKKLVYLYVLSTAKLEPDKALLAVNTFLQDATNPSPIVRGLAIRSMMCIRVPTVLEYTTEALRRAVKDPDPYVRKAAALGLGKLHHHNMDLFFQQHFQDELNTLLMDPVAVVSSNAVSVLTEICDYSNFTVAPPPTLPNRLIYQLAECSEWGQCAILEHLSREKISNQASATAATERILPRLSHTNPAVVMGAIKVLVQYSSKCPQDVIDRFIPRINAALLTLARADAETQYVVCKNIHALLVVFPNLLRHNLDAFYVRFSDPAFVKREKLALLLKLVTPATAPAIARELEEYSTEVDKSFVEKVVEAIAFLAIKVESVAADCAQLLMKVAARRPELLPRVITAAKNVVRRHPDLLLLEPLINEFGADLVVEEEARVSLIWMLGEYCDYIPTGRDILMGYVADFAQQEHSVQLALLSAVIKMFLRDPAGMQQTLSELLQSITAQGTDADLRDRALVYWRLLSNGAGVEQMRAIVHGSAAPVSVDRTFSDAMTMTDLKRSLNTAAVVFGKPYASFLRPYGIPDEELESDDDDDDAGAADDAAGDEPDDTGAASSPPQGQQQQQQQQQQQAQTAVAAPIEDLFAPPPLPADNGPVSQKTLDDLFK